MSATPPMRCGDITPYLSAFLDDELAEPLRDAVETHVGACADCQGKLDRLARVDLLLAALPESRPAPDVLDRVLAAAQQRHPGPVVRESLRQHKRRLTSRGQPSFLRADNATLPPRPTLPPTSRRSVVLTAVLPALAAMLILSMTLVVFHRLPSRDANSQVTKGESTSVPPGTAVQQAQRAVERYAAQLAFTPALPTYLPPSSQRPVVTVGPANAGVSSHVLDVVWRWSCSTCEVSEVHLREAPYPLGVRNDWAVAPAQPLLSWQVPGAGPWRPGTLQAPSELGRWAVGQDRAGFSITLDVAGKSSGTNGPSDAEANALRLISLSMDLPYAALTVTPPNFATTQVHFTAQSTVGGGTTWDGVVTPGNLENVTVTGASGQYTDVSNGMSVLRVNDATHTYATLTASAAGDPAFSTAQQELFLDVNTYLSYGELWPIPGSVTFDAKPAERLFLVGAPYATYVYVEAGSLRVLGATVYYGSPLRPGGPGAASKLTPSGGCLKYVRVSFQPWTQAQGSAFRLTPKPGYQPGPIPSNMSC